MDELTVRKLVYAVQEADKWFDRTGGGTKHWLRECFLPQLERQGLGIAILWEKDHVVTDPMMEDMMRRAPIMDLMPIKGRAQPKFKVGDHVYETNGTFVRDDIGLLTVTKVEWADPTPTWGSSAYPYWLVSAVADDGPVTQASEEFFIHANDIFIKDEETALVKKWRWLV